jgi:hypothetical protein
LLAVTGHGAPALLTPEAVVKALLEGEQVVDVRPGDSARLGGAPTHFWLCPTPVDATALKPAYRLARQLQGGDATQVAIEGWAELVGLGSLSDRSRLPDLDSKSVLALSTLEEWMTKGGLAVLALRVHRLIDPVELAAPPPAGQDGWVRLEGLPAEPGVAKSEPALSEVAFKAKLAGVAEALPGGLTPL